MTETKNLLREIIPTMNGWLTPERAIEMYELVRLLKPSLVVEIGVFAGRSLIAQALALRDNQFGKIIGIDPWKKTAAFEGETDEAAMKWWNENVDLHAMHKECMEWVWKFDLDRFVTIICSASQDCHELIPRFQIGYIDGNHSEVASCRDVELYLPKLMQNGYLWFDDVDWPSTQKALATIETQCVRYKDEPQYRLYVKK